MESADGKNYLTDEWEERGVQIVIAGHDPQSMRPGVQVSWIADQVRNDSRGPQ
jgi:hypothetical protein